MGSARYPWHLVRNLSPRLHVLQSRMVPCPFGFRRRSLPLVLAPHALLSLPFTMGPARPHCRSHARCLFPQWRVPRASASRCRPLLRVPPPPPELRCPPPPVRRQLPLPPPHCHQRPAYPDHPPHRFRRLLSLRLLRRRALALERPVLARCSLLERPRPPLLDTTSLPRSCWPLAWPARSPLARRRSLFCPRFRRLLLRLLQLSLLGRHGLFRQSLLPLPHSNLRFRPGHPLPARGSPPPLAPLDPRSRPGLLPRCRIQPSLCRSAPTRSASPRLPLPPLRSHAPNRAARYRSTQLSFSAQLIPSPPASP